MAKTDQGKPYPFLAIICEKALREADGVTSFIRVIDLLTLQGRTEEMLPGAVAFVIAIGFRAGGFRGKKPLSLKVIGPSGKKKQIAAIEMDFKEETGAFLIINTALAVREQGYYWIDVLMEGKRRARIPLQIRYEKVEPSSPSADSTAQQRKRAKKLKTQR